MIEYQEKEMKDIMQWFIEGYKLGDQLSTYDWFYDPKNGKVIIKLYIKELEKTD